MRSLSPLVFEFYSFLDIYRCTYYIPGCVLWAHRLGYTTLILFAYHHFFNFNGYMPMLDMFIGGLLLPTTTRLSLSWIFSEAVIAVCLLFVFCGAWILIFWFHHIVWLWNLYWYLSFIWIYVMNQIFSCITTYCWHYSHHTYPAAILKELFPCDTSSTLDYEAVVLEL